MYERGKNIPQLACDVMSSPAVTVEQSSTVAMALCLMYRHHVSRLPVVDDTGRLCGIITYNGIRRFKLLQTLQHDASAHGESQHILTVREMMTGQSVAITPETTLYDACDLMVVHKISALPVVDGGGGVVGILTEQDLFELLILRHERKQDTITSIYRPASRHEQLLAG